VGLLWETVGLQLDGALTEAVDRAAGRYEIQAVGDGGRLRNRLESRGVLRGGRWAPERTRAWFEVLGRQAETVVAYDYQARVVEYRARAETFFRRRMRVVDDALAMPGGRHVDDALSALLNIVDGRWAPDEDGQLRTHIVRRHRPPSEGPDDAEGTYRAELVPLVLEPLRRLEGEAYGTTFDLTRFSSWAPEGERARIAFSPDRRPRAVTARLLFGTSLRISFQPAS
jgi:hypothetical protein